MSMSLMKRKSRKRLHIPNYLLWISYVTEFLPTLKLKILGARLPCKEKGPLKAGLSVDLGSKAPAAVLHYRPKEDNLETLFQEQRTYPSAKHVAVLDAAQWAPQRLSLLKAAQFQLFDVSKSFRHARVVQFLHKHVEPTGDSWHKIGPLWINFQTLQIPVWGRLKSLTPFTCRLLVFLVQYFQKHPDAPYVPKETLFQGVWGYPSYNDYRTLHTHIHRLRQILEDDPQHPRVLKTVGNRGYFLDLKWLSIIISAEQPIPKAV